MKRQWEWLNVFMIPVGIITIWQILSISGLLDSSMVPSPLGVADSFLSGIKNGKVLAYTKISLFRVVKGFSFATAAGVICGFSVGWSKKVRIYIDPLLNFLRQIPPVAWIPVFIIWFGIGEGSKVSVIAYAAFFPVFLNTESAVSTVETDYLEMAGLFRFSWIQTVTRIVIPGSIGPIFVGIRLALGNSWKALVAAEMLAASSGLGYMIAISRELVRPDEMFLGIFLIGVFGYAFDVLALNIQKRIAPWT